MDQLSNFSLGYGLKEIVIPCFSSQLEACNFSKELVTRLRANHELLFQQQDLTYEIRQVVTNCYTVNSAPTSFGPYTEYMVVFKFPTTEGVLYATVEQEIKAKISSNQLKNVTTSKSNVSYIGYTQFLPAPIPLSNS